MAILDCVPTFVHNFAGRYDLFHVLDAFSAIFFVSHLLRKKKKYKLT